MLENSGSPVESPAQPAGGGGGAGEAGPAAAAAAAGEDEVAAAEVRRPSLIGPSIADLTSVADH